MSTLRETASSIKPWPDIAPLLQCNPTSKKEFVDALEQLDAKLESLENRSKTAHELLGPKSGPGWNMDYFEENYAQRLYVESKKRELLNSTGTAKLLSELLDASVSWNTDSYGATTKNYSSEYENTLLRHGLAYETLPHPYFLRIHITKNFFDNLKNAVVEKRLKESKERLADQGVSITSVTGFNGGWLDKNARGHIVEKVEKELWDNLEPARIR